MMGRTLAISVAMKRIVCCAIQRTSVLYDIVTLVMHQSVKKCTHNGTWGDT